MGGGGQLPSPPLLRPLENICLTLIVDARDVEFFRDFPCHWHPIADFDNTEFHVDVCDEPSRSGRRKIVRLLSIELDVKIF